jgi:hypothetical protein
MEMGCQVSDNLRRAIAAFLLIGVSATTAITAIRQYSTAYMMVESSREYALVASFMVVGALVLAVMFPASSRWGFPVLAGSLVLEMGPDGRRGLPNRRDPLATPQPRTESESDRKRPKATED